MALITTKELQALKADRNGNRISLGKSLYGTVRADQKGCISVYVVWRYKVDGKVRQTPVGTWRDDRESMSLKAIFEKRDDLAAELRNGVDPIEQKAARRLEQKADQQEAINRQKLRLEAIAESQARQTVRGLFSQWLSLEASKRTDGGAEVQRSFERDVFPLIGEIAAEDVTKGHIQRILDAIAARATPTQNMVRTGKKTLSDLRQMFSFALDRDQIEADPTARIRKSRIGEDGEGSRVLSEAELIALFQKIPQAGLATTSQHALLIQLSTITRIGEVLGARWEHVDFERGTWYLPDTKNNESHTIQLSDFAVGQFEDLRKLTGLTSWCFPDSRLAGPVCAKTVTKQVADRQRDGKPMAGRSKQVDSLSLPGGQWRPHDLRRTGATMMAELGVLPDVVEKCLNHKEPKKIKRIYQRAQYAGPMLDAWRLLGERLSLLKDRPDNVVLLKAA